MSLTTALRELLVMCDKAYPADPAWMTATEKLNQLQDKSLQHHVSQELVTLADSAMSNLPDQLFNDFAWAERACKTLESLSTKFEQHGKAFWRAKATWTMYTRCSPASRMSSQ